MIFRKKIDMRSIYINEYLFPKEWQIKEFVRGTLRLNGWSNAWNEIFIMLNRS